MKSLWHDEPTLKIISVLKQKANEEVLFPSRHSVWIRQPMGHTTIGDSTKTIVRPNFIGLKFGVKPKFGFYGICY